MAEIYLARLTQTAGDLVVIKRMLPHFSRDRDFVEMFIDEARISATLDHANIVPVFDLGRIEDDCYIAMQYVDGKDLQAVMQVCVDRGTQLGPDHVAFVGQHMCRGLEYAHTKRNARGEPLNIVHRDISPQNILISYDGEVKITDFGIAKAESKLNRTQAGILKGKFAYMSPEQVMGRDIDNRHDIFSAGIILYELLAGARLFTGKVEWEILQKIRLGHIDPLTKYNPNVPKNLQKIIYRALTVDRDKRYPSAKEMEEELTVYLAKHNPRYSGSDLSDLMHNLFEKEMNEHRQRVQKAISQLAPSMRAERGAVLESTVPGAEDVFRPKSNSGPHPPPPPPPNRNQSSVEAQVARRLGTDPSAPHPAPPPPPRLSKVKEIPVGRRGPSPALWAVALALVVLVATFGVLWFLQPPWFQNLIGPRTQETPQPTTTAVAQTATPTPTPMPTATEEPSATETLAAAPSATDAAATATPPPTATATTTPTEVAMTEETPPPGETWLAVLSVPSGASLVIDGNELGKTPVTVKELIPGTRHVIEVSLDGYHTQRRPWVAGRGLVNLTFKLDAADAITEQPDDTPALAMPGFLTVKVVNGTGRVFVDDALIASTTPVHKHKLPPGKHTVRIENWTTGQTKTFDVTIRSGRENTQRIRL